MHYIIGDIHGYLNKLISLVSAIKSSLQQEDVFIFLGDYIDRGPYSFEVIEYLLNFRKNHRCVFLKGNHEDMMMKFLEGKIHDLYLINGGGATIKSYIRNSGEFTLSAAHKKFFNSLQLYFEGDNFITVHAGLNPMIDNIENQKQDDLLWIREDFYLAEKRWKKTVIFGHTPVPLLSPGSIDSVYFDNKRNIIGIDSGVILGREISCLRWPDKKLFFSD